MSTEEKNVGLELTLNDVMDHEPTRLEYIEAIKEKLKSHSYLSMKNYLEDIELVFHNCIMYNGEAS